MPLRKLSTSSSSYMRWILLFGLASLMLLFIWSSSSSSSSVHVHQLSNNNKPVNQQPDLLSIEQLEQLEQQLPQQQDDEVEGEANDDGEDLGQQQQQQQQVRTDNVLKTVMFAFPDLYNGLLTREEEELMREKYFALKNAVTFKETDGFYRRVIENWVSLPNTKLVLVVKPIARNFLDRILEKRNFSLEDVQVYESTSTASFDVRKFFLESSELDLREFAFVGFAFGNIMFSHYGEFEATLDSLNTFETNREEAVKFATGLLRFPVSKGALHRLVDYDPLDKIKKLKSNAYVSDNQHFAFVSADAFRNDQIAAFPEILLNNAFMGSELFHWALSRESEIETYDVTDALKVMHLQIIQLHKKRENYIENPLRDIPISVLSDSLYRIQKIGPSNILRRCLSKECGPSEFLLNSLAPNKQVLASSPNCAYLDMSINWIAHIVDLDSPPNYVFFPKDSQSFRFLESLTPGHSIQKYQCLSQDSAEITEATVFGSKKFKSLVKGRPDKIRLLLNRGITVFWSDTDIVFLKNPFDHIPNIDQVETAVQYDYNWVCTCLLFMKPNEANLKLLDQWEKDIPRFKEDQAAFQSPIKSLMRTTNYKEKFTNLPENLFPNGKTFFESTSPSETYAVVAIHNNWIRGYSKKLDRFKTYNVWKSDALLDQYHRPQCFPPQQ